MLYLIFCLAVGVLIGTLISRSFIPLWCAWNKKKKRVFSVGVVLDTHSVDDLVKELSLDRDRIKDAFLKDAYEYITFASEVFQKEFGIEFLVKEIGEAAFPLEKEGVDTDKFFQETPSMQKRMDADIILGLTIKELCKYEGEQGKKKQIDAHKTIGGRANTTGGIIVQLANDKKRVTFYIIHEFAHLFFALHSNDKNSIMYHKEGDILPPIHFDKKSRTQILIHKNRAFGHSPEL